MIKELVWTEVVASYDEALEFVDESVDSLPEEYDVIGVHIRMLDQVNWRITATFGKLPEIAEEDVDESA